MSRTHDDDDLERVARLLETLEAEHHAAGWDNTPAKLYRCGPDPAGEWCVGSVELSGNPRTSLQALAAAAADPGRAAIIETGFDRPPVAHLLIGEGWQRHEADAGDTRRFADIPGSVEMRFGIAVVLASGVAGVHRVRAQAVKNVPRWCTLAVGVALGILLGRSGQHHDWISVTLVLVVSVWVGWSSLSLFFTEWKRTR